MELPEGTKTMILAPMVRGRRGSHKDVFAAIRKAGLVRARVDGDVYDLDNLPELSTRKTHNIDAVVDRVIIREGIAGRIGDSVSLAIQHAAGLVEVFYLTPEAEEASHANTSWQSQLFSTQHACPNCDISYEEIQPRTFSFNSPYGACPVCEGIGLLEQFDLESIIPDDKLSLSDNAVIAWKNATAAAGKKHREAVDPFLAKHLSLIHI